MSKAPKKPKKSVPTLSKGYSILEPESLGGYTDRHFTSYICLLSKKSSCKPVEIRSYTKCSVQVSGTIEGDITITGSNDGKEFYPLTKDGVVPLTDLSPGLYAICENVRYLKPETSENSKCSIVLFGTV
jgi:hypothetical protein